MHSIGQRIKAQRKKKGLTQPRIRELTGISSGTMSDIENGKALPATPSLIKLSKVLECSIDWILTGNPPASENPLQDPRETELINGFRELSEEDKEELLGILQIKRHKAQKPKKPSVKSSGLNSTESDSMVG